MPRFITAPICLAFSTAIGLTAYVEFAQAETPVHWQQQGEAALRSAQTLAPNTKPAKNVILFVGDGMGISTITAARIFAGQQQGLSGESYQLSFEKFPYVALSKTYSANQQTPDSAPTMSAMMTGYKTNDAVLSLNQTIASKETDPAKIQAATVKTILEYAETKGLATGIVTTTRLTHATPAATYAHTSFRDWESDAQLPAHAKVKDIAAQLIDHFGAVGGGKKGIGDGLEVALGGGRVKFLPNTMHDPEYPNIVGQRLDGRNLIAEFQQKFGASYVWNKAQFDAISPKNTKRLLGVFEPSHMQYAHDRPKDGAGEPSLAEMTSKAIAILANPSNQHKGYFLMVEAGRIDHAHHAGNAYRALSETVALSEAVQTALQNVNLAETLIIVTADHSHAFTMGGYPARGNPILGKVKNIGDAEYAKAEDGKPYTTLSYANGLGFHEAHDVEGLTEDALKPRSGRVGDLTQVDTEHPDFHQEANVPLKAETHAGEDVAIYAIGPQAHLFHGTQEQTFVFYVIQHALGLSKGLSK